MDETVKPHRLCRAALCAALAAFAGGAALAAPASVNWVAAKSVVRTPLISAFASEQPGGVVAVTSVQSGVLSGLAVLPGQRVAAGQVIARLGGQQVAAALAQAQGALADATAARDAAAISLAAEQQKLRQHLSTRQLVAQARAALATATAQLATAAANLTALRQAVVLRSPLAGVVQSVPAASGDFLTAGKVAATIQPVSGAWLRAVFYNAAADIAPGAMGMFTPGNGGAPVPVRVRGALGVVQADGGLPVALTPGSPLAPGIFGTVTLTLPEQAATTVPADALILDKGQWWVMLHTAQGDHPVAVVPGPALGDDTVIKSGLKPGEDVVVVDAYLLYHRGIAALYQPPD